MVTCQYNSIEYTEYKACACIGNTCGVNMYFGLRQGTVGMWKRKKHRFVLQQWHSPLSERFP